MKPLSAPGERRARRYPRDGKQADAEPQGPINRTRRPASRSSAAWEAHYLMIGLTLASIVGVYLVLRPYLYAIILALLLTTIFKPLHQWLLRSVRERRNLAAFLAVLTVSLLVIVPAAVMITALVQQGMTTFQAARDWLQEGNLQQALESERMQEFMNHPRVAQIRMFLQEHLSAINFQSPNIADKLLQGSQAVLQFVGSQVLPVLGMTGGLILKFMLMLFIMFYAFRDGERMLAYLLHLSPLAASQENAVIDRIRAVARAALVGTLGTAALQGAIAAIAFWIVGIPALFWGAVLGAASLIPVVGTTVVWLPATIYLLIMGRLGAALFLALWCAILVGLSDNLVRPYLMHGRTGMSSFLLFLAVIGGLNTIGLFGVVLGPLIFGLCAVALYIYEMENAEFLEMQDRR